MVPKFELVELVEVELVEVVEVELPGYNTRLPTLKRSIGILLVVSNEFNLFNPSHSRATSQSTLSSESF